MVGERMRFNHGHGVPLFGITLVLIGLFWLARDQIPMLQELPIWPFILILLGIYFIVKRLSCC